MLYLSLLFLLLAASDVYVTIRMIRRKGLRREANSFIRFLVRKLGVALGATVGISLPTLALLVFCLCFHLDHTLAFLAGMRCYLMYTHASAYKTPSVYGIK